jgi:hypothetical protein
VGEPVGRSSVGIFRLRGGRKLDLSGSGQGLVVVLYKHDNENLCCIDCGQFIDSLRDHTFQKRISPANTLALTTTRYAITGPK